MYIIICVCQYLSICLSLSISFYICLSVYLTTCLFLCLVNQSICLSICLFLCLSNIRTDLLNGFANREYQGSIHERHNDISIKLIVTSLFHCPDSIWVTLIPIPTLFSRQSFTFYALLSESLFVF